MSELAKPDHPIWKLVRMLVIGLLAFLFLSFNYDRFDNRDLITILGLVLGVGGFDQLKAQLTKRNENGEDSKA